MGGGVGLALTSPAAQRTILIFTVATVITVVNMVDRPSFPMLSWPEVKKIIQDGRLDLLGRSASQQQVYRQFREQLEIEWKSVSDYILCTKLSYEESSHEGKRVAVRPAEVQTRTVLLENDFPYHFEEGIHHMVLWKLGGEVLPSDIESSIQHLQSIHNSIDTAVYINPTHLKSILDVEHAHILFVQEKKM